MKYTNEFIPIISKEEIEEIAEEFLTQYYPKALEKPTAVPIELIAEKDLGLTLDYANLSEDLSILGVMVFSDGKLEIYKKDTDEFIYRNVRKGTIVIDSDLYDNGGLGRERFTITHEVVHWIEHPLRFSTLAYKDSCIIKATKYNRKKVKSISTPEDWLEWQADGISAAILMPKLTFIQEANRLRKAYDIKLACFPFSDQMIWQIIASDLAELFKVSKQAAYIRLNSLKEIS